MTNRDKASGKYVDTKFDKPCVCGHSLGSHTADRKDGYQPCLHQDCECEAFRKAPRKSVKIVRDLCSKCEGGQTETDRDAGYCTQCGHPHSGPSDSLIVSLRAAARR